MKLFGKEIKTSLDKKAAPGNSKSSLDIKHQADRALALIIRYQISIIAVAVIGLLALTTLRMMQYADPATDDTKVQENLNKFKQVRIDPKIVKRINALNETQTTTSTQLESNRTNPFSE